MNVMITNSKIGKVLVPGDKCKLQVRILLEINNNFLFVLTVKLSCKPPRTIQFATSFPDVKLEFGSNYFTKNYWIFIGEVIS